MLKMSLLLLLIGLILLVSSCDRSPPDMRSMHEKEVEDYPWTVGIGGLYCDTGPYAEWHFCHTPEVIIAEHFRREITESGWCESVELQNSYRESSADWYETLLEQYPDSCQKEKLQGYDEAIEKKFGPVLRAMKIKQGSHIPELSNEEHAKCQLAESIAYDPDVSSIIAEIQIRRCAWQIVSG